MNRQIIKLFQIFTIQFTILILFTYNGPAEALKISHSSSAKLFNLNPHPFYWIPHWNGLNTFLNGWQHNYLNKIRRRNSHVPRPNNIPSHRYRHRETDHGYAAILG